MRGRERIFEAVDVRPEISMASVFLLALLLALVLKDNVFVNLSFCGTIILSCPDDSVAAYTRPLNPL